MVGQFDEFGKTMRDAEGVENWERGLEAMHRYRSLGDDRLACLLVDPGGGHFAWSERQARYAATFLRNAALLIADGRPPKVSRLDVLLLSQSWYRFCCPHFLGLKVLWFFVSSHCWG